MFGLAWTHGPAAFSYGGRTHAYNLNETDEEYLTYTGLNLVPEGDGLLLKMNYEGRSWRGSCMNLVGPIGAKTILKERKGQQHVELVWLESVLANKHVHFFYSFFELCTTTKFWSSNKALFGEAHREDGPDAEELFLDEVLRDESDINTICTVEETKKLAR